MFIALYTTAFLPWDFYQDLLTNKQFSIEILSGSLIMLDSENIELVWSNLPLKCIVLMANKYPVDWTFVWCQTISIV